MHILSAKYGGFIVPSQHKLEENKSQLKTLKGYGGRINVYGITVDSPAKNYKEYCTQMIQYENIFVRRLINDTTPKGWEV